MATTNSSHVRAKRIAATATAVVLLTAPAYAQLDPLLFLKRTPPNVLLVVDVANRMQRDAPRDPGNPQATSNYYDPFLYKRTGAAWENTLGITPLNTVTSYRRRYGFKADGTCPDGTQTCGMRYGNGGSGDKFIAGSIAVTKDQDPNFAMFDASTRLAIARAALYQAVNQNKNVARFGLLKMRQSSPTMPATGGNSGPVADADPMQLSPTDSGSISGRWNVTRPTVTSSNLNSNASAAAVVVKADSGTANTDVLSVLSKMPRDASSNGFSPLVPAGSDDINTVDAPVNNMLVDAQTEAARLLKNDANCTNTVVVLVVGGAEGSNADPTVTAAQFLNISGRRVPIYVVAIAPASADVAQLQNIAAKSGGLYFEIPKNQIDSGRASQMWWPPPSGAPPRTVVRPGGSKAINVAIQAAFETYEDLNTKTLYTTPLPAGVSSIIPVSEFQVSAPIIGTVNMKNLVANTPSGPVTLTPDPDTVTDRAHNIIPQRSNLMVTSAFTLPGFDGTLRAFRTYKAVADSTQPSGWKFSSDGTPLWTAHAPVAANRNLYTTLADGTMIAFTAANVAQLAPLMNLNPTDAGNVINVVRNYPVGTVLDSTPAIMNPPSLDPPPDDTYPGFASKQKNRRTLVFLGTNRGILEAFDGRTGLEVWGYIPMNLLPKLRTLMDGQAVGSVDFLMDGSPKIADIRLADGTWHTYMFIGQGAGGTFYQAIDVTLAGMGDNAFPNGLLQTDDDNGDLLTFFSNPNVMPVRWSFPSLTDWDPTITNNANATDANNPYLMHYGDIKKTAATISKTVGQTWSDPAVGQVVNTTSPYVVLAGSGFLPYSAQQQSNRGGTIAGTTFYILKAEDGTLLDTRDAGNDGTVETLDNCVAINDCTKFKNALQSDPVATGPSDSRFITKAYIADLDGRIWRFDITLDPTNKPIFVTTGTNPVKMYEDALKQPFFSSMATVNVGGTQQFIFAATGADLLPANGVSTQYRLLGVLDNGATGSKTFEIDLTKVDGTAGDEKVTAFPAVAGDIVFFTTTTFNPATPCTLPTASLYALTFIGGPAYDTNNDGTFDKKDSTLVKSIAGVRATAPFIVDQHLVFGAGNRVQVFGDKDDYNNGIGQAGVRILSWREVR